MADEATTLGQRQGRRRRPLQGPATMRTTSTTALLYAAAVASLVSAPHAALAFSGDMTYYNTETGNQGACGGFLSNSDYLVALNAPQYYEVSNHHCGEQLCIGGKATATVRDQCPECAYGSLDASPALFQVFNPFSVGRFQMSWEWGACGSGGGGGGNPTTTKQPDPTTQQEPTTTWQPPATTSDTPTPDPTTSSTTSSTSSTTTSSSSSSSSSSRNSTVTSTSSARNTTSSALPTSTGRPVIPLNAPVSWPAVEPANVVPLSLRNHCSIKYRPSLTATSTSTSSSPLPTSSVTTSSASSNGTTSTTSSGSSSSGVSPTTSSK